MAMAAVATSDQGSPSYSRVIGFVYIFNLIVGTGMLTMPRAFQQAGWVTGIVVVYLLALMGYMTATFLVETMSIANGLTKLAIRKLPVKTDQHRRLTSFGGSSQSSIANSQSLADDHTPLLAGNVLSRIGINEPNPFEITQKYQFSEMVTLFLPRPFLVIFYASFCAELFGVLSVYAAAVPKSIRDLACNEILVPTNNSDSLPCWKTNPHFTRQHAYWTFLAGFAVCVLPFTFFNISRTKYLQIVGTALRWLALLLMLVLTFIGLSRSELPNTNHAPLHLSKIPTLFGVCVFSFMWHHTLPNVVAPIRNKTGIHLLLLADVAVIMGIYLLLSVTAVFTFPQVKDLYTLNFNPTPEEPDSRVPDIAVLGYFLVLYPVFTLSTNFPLMAITLRENLKVLVKQIICLCTHRPLHVVSEGGIVLPRWLEFFAFPLLAVIPVLGIAFYTNDLTQMAGYTGAYAGTTLQYIFPACLVWYARASLQSNFPEQTWSSLQVRRSPFGHSAYIIVVLAWAAISIVLVSVHVFVDY